MPLRKTLAAAFPLAWWRPLLALLAAFVLASDMVALHDVAVEQVGMVSQVEIAEAAVHPGDPAHIENAEFKLHPGCAACLLQLGHGIVPSRLLAPLPPLPQSDPIAAPVARFSAAQPSLLGPARAPPIASPSA
ncbi:MAG: hypothetical protein ACJ759_11135 [Thermoanaerobaculia bacterium]